MSEEHDPAEVAAAALKLLWEQQKGRNVEVQPMDGDGERAEAGMTRLFLTAGRNQGVRPTDLVGAISNEAGIPGNTIGAIDIMDNCAFVEVPEDVAERVIEALSRTKLRGRRIRVQAARPGAEPEEDLPPIEPGRPRRPTFRSQGFRGRGRRPG